MCVSLVFHVFGVKVDTGYYSNLHFLKQKSIKWGDLVIFFLNQLNAIIPCCFTHLSQKDSSKYKGTFFLTFKFSFFFFAKKGLHFIMMNFKPSAWWFGLVPLLRGPLISVPAVIATDQPGVNLALMFQVLLVPLVAQENTCRKKRG